MADEEKLGTSLKDFIPNQPKIELKEPIGDMKYSDNYKWYVGGALTKYAIGSIVWAITVFGLVQVALGLLGLL